MGLITTVSPYRGSLSPQPISFSTYLFNYRNYHAQTALHELVDDHVFLTSAQCKWHSNPNFCGEMEWRRFVWCASQTCWCQSSQVFGRVCLCIRHACTECQAFEGSLASMLYWSNVLFLLDTLKPCYLQTLSIIKASAKSTVLQKSPWWRVAAVRINTLYRHKRPTSPGGEESTAL